MEQVEQEGGEAFLCGIERSLKERTYAPTKCGGVYIGKANSKSGKTGKDKRKERTEIFLGGRPAARHYLVGKIAINSSQDFYLQYIVEVLPQLKKGLHQHMYVILSI